MGLTLFMKDQHINTNLELLKTTLRSHQEAGAKLKEKMLELIKKQEDAILERAEITLAYAVWYI